MSRQQNLFERFIECGLPLCAIKEIPPAAMSRVLNGTSALLIVAYPCKNHLCKEPHRGMWSIENHLLPPEIRKLLTESV